MVNRADFPNDDDGEVLYRLALDGVDLTRKRRIDFSCDARDEEVANKIVTDLASYGYQSRVFIDDGDGGSGDASVYAGIIMLPEHALLLIEQDRLNAILKHHSTKCDGWVTES